MISGKDLLLVYAEEAGVELDLTGEISFDVFAKCGLPPIVSCCSCGETMVVTSCFVDTEMDVYCESCAGIVE